MRSSVSGALVAAGAALALTSFAVAATPKVTKVGPPPPKLFAMVTPTNQFSFKDGHGNPVVHLKAGWYTLTISNRDAKQSFRLKGPGLNRSTTPHFEGAAIWGVNLHKGTYSYASVGSVMISHTFSVG